MDLKYYKIEVNDESKETKYTYIVVCEICNPIKKTLVWIFETNIEFFFSCFEIERNHKVQCDHDTKLVWPKTL